MSDCGTGEHLDYSGRNDLCSIRELFSSAQATVEYIPDFICGEDLGSYQDRYHRELDEKMDYNPIES
jgi:hypothetical protein